MEEFPPVGWAFDGPELTGRQLQTCQVQRPLPSELRR